MSAPYLTNPEWGKHDPEMFVCRDCGETFDEQDGTTSGESAAVLLCRECAKAECLVETAPSASVTSIEEMAPAAR